MVSFCRFAGDTTIRDLCLSAGGDNNNILWKFIKDDSVDLCYIDPPFDSKRNYNQTYNNVLSRLDTEITAVIDTFIS